VVHVKFSRAFLVLAAPLILLTACATPPKDPAARAQFEANNDPLEPMNRQIFAFDMFLDTWFFKPLAQTYVAVMPPIGREAVSNFLGNLHEPVIFANNVLQTEFSRAGTTAERFVLNSTVGVGGLFDVASKWGMHKQTGDFGQTLAHYGVGEFFYLVLPILGPSNPRDIVGTAVDGLADPFSYLAYDYGADVATYARWGGEGLGARAQNLQNFDELQRTSIDLYAAVRSLYRQHRESEIRHGERAPSPVNNMKDLYQDPNAVAPKDGASPGDKGGTAPAPAAH
jgi:phospholipid-binding lipoprotein MlaA